MINAYNELYLRNVMHTLSCFFDLAINELNMEPDDIATKFAKSMIAKNIEHGNPKYLSGKSATEMLSILLGDDIKVYKVPINRSKEYWAGWILAYSAWYLNRSFEEIINVLPFSRLIMLYHPFHEAPEMKVVAIIDSYFSKGTSLKKYRMKRNLSQNELAILSGVKLRSIQCYEQGDIDIKNAKVETIYALSKALDCTIEELIK